jgi:tetratricopeptide (TPR) repeat protein
MPLLLLASSRAAESFPFRALERGGALPAVTVRDVDSGALLALDALGGRNTVLFFWGGDVPAKKERSLSALTRLRQLAPFFQARQVRLVVINAQGDPAETIREVAAASGINWPMYADPEQSAYGALGIYVMPAVLLVDTQGRAVEGFGYGRDMVAGLMGEIEILLGEKSRAGVEAELRPQMAEKSREEKEGLRHLGLGNAMLGKGQLEAAAREYEQAVAREPKLAAAHIGLGCVLVDLRRLPEAEESLARGLDLAPDSLAGEICAARLRAGKGQVAEAIADLQALLFRNGRDPHLRFVLGTLYEKKGDYEKAALEFRRAYEFLEKTERPEE